MSRAEVSPQSELQLKLAPVKLPNDLALLPAPFFDRRDQSRLNLTMVVPQGNGLTEPARLQAMAAVASWFGFESPLQSERSVLVVTANDEAQLPWVADALEDRARVGLMRGDLVLLRDKQVASFRLNEPYYVGDLSWWMQIWFVLSRYPLLMAVAGGFSGLLIAIGMFMALKRIARQRLGE
ncbi:cellulose biosynthesis cyclic di-GMP-binding regulatory protein BcsB [Aquaspirillum serpens]|uniref:cellulose biosynthesis cyclic di-GMP-binding regulatory protein BcsB n=1 Tax=Aquaspirillum serpens TaxID=190 RepID=UPI0003B3DB78|nr:cellulose biosynthesis cyclic di-GMP-binding regulatory protein BcsB [Aquaspirillum serpens]